MKRIFQKLLRAARRSPNPPPIIFLHVPKSGGTSLDRVLERLYPPTSEGNIGFGSVTRGWQLASGYTSPESEDSMTWLEVVNTVVCYKVACRAPYLSGHFAVTEDLLNQAKPIYRFLTLVRDPVQRWKSNYVYSRIREAQDGKRESPKDIHLELEEYLSSPQAFQEGAKYVRYLGGFKTPERLGEAETIESAKRLLSKFDAVGVLDNLERFEQRVSDLVGASIRVPHLRRTEEFREPNGRTSADYNALFTPDIEARVRAVCTPDYAIYEHAQSMEGVARKGADSEAKPSGRRSSSVASSPPTRSSQTA